MPGLKTSSQDLGTDWDSLRGLTKNVPQKPRSTWLRTALLAVLLIVALAFLGLLLHDHMPALVSFGQELSETVHRFASGTPTPSTAAHGAALPDLRRARSKHRASNFSVPESLPEQVDDPAFRPFYATAVIAGRRVALASNNGIVVLDVATGSWNFASQSE
ncbi:MAG TPA: hypothetical protein VJQ50_08250 [Terriglobales bacterium]|nr:hypothetical protein [Terriglobales bacterium]